MKWQNLTQLDGMTLRTHGNQPKCVASVCLRFLFHFSFLILTESEEAQLVEGLNILKIIDQTVHPALKFNYRNCDTTSVSCLV